MELRIETVATNVIRARPIGRWDTKGAADIDLRLGAIVATSGAVIVDLAEVTYLASMGMRAIVIGAKAVAARGGKLVLLSPPPMIEAVLKTAGIDQTIPIYHALDAATQAVVA